MKLARYLLEQQEIALPYLNKDIALGRDIVLSNERTDLSFTQDWYPEGYKVYKAFDQDEFMSMRKSVENAVTSIMKKELNLSSVDFNLEDYHSFVPTDQDHYKIVSRARDLFSHDFSFPILSCLERLGELVKTKLTDLNPQTGHRIHIIIRINRPKSHDFNPPHKDIYGDYEGNVVSSPNFINFWIPICGVTRNSSLPIAPGSHLFPESEIERSLSGAIIGGNRYRVNLVLNWGGSNRLSRTNLDAGEALCFSPHLIHGLAANQESDQTRVALELRLYEDMKS